MGKILYIEDNAINLELVVRILRREAYEILEAMDGLSGLSIAAQQQPDLILLDINMPGMDGFEVLRRLKASPDLRHIPVVALTANAMHGDKERILKAGFDGYLPKPISRQELRNTIAYFLDQAGAQK